MEILKINNCIFEIIHCFVKIISYLYFMAGGVIVLVTLIIYGYIIYGELYTMFLKVKKKMLCFLRNWS